MRLIFVACLLLVVGGGVYLAAHTPLLERTWSLDQAVLPAVSWVDGDTVTIQNVRNFSYTSVEDYTPAYYDTTLALTDIERVDYIVEPFGSIGAAHTFLSFGLSDGQQIAVSVEIRKEEGETFSPWRGVLRQYELMYVVADERDVIGLRALQRGNPVYLYPTSATPAQAQALFVSVLERIDRLTHTPEFYNTVTNNCTTNILAHINTLTTEPIGWDYRVLFPENSDALAQELGFIAPGVPIAVAREAALVNERVARFINDPHFSQLIRADVVVSDVSEHTTYPMAVAPPQLTPHASVAGSLYRVVRVIDGDTIEVDDEGVRRRVRYIGVDTPETVHPSQPTGCFGREASTYNSSLVAGQLVRLERDISDVDTYGRWLRYVYVDDTFVNLELVAGGYAQVVTYPPDVRHTDTFRVAETAARTAGRGLWGAVCAGQYEPRREPVSVAGSDPIDASCGIKGNISQTSGERIYHVPGCEYYSATVITESAGERWFCTETEALAAGWRKALNCP